MSFTLAHFSDLHLGPLPHGAAWHDFRSKRLIGYLSWHMQRKHLHKPEIADALLHDVQATAPNHIAFTGDAANVASPLEFPHLRRWLDRLGPPDQISYVPGNHDAYVKVAPEKSIAAFAPFMVGDMRLDAPFPYVRLRRNVALIGLNSGIPRPWHSAEGCLGAQQLSRLAPLLAELKGKGFYRAVMIHHPPAPGLAARLRRLIDAPQLRDVLLAQGAELVIHGHNHRRELHWLESGGQKIPLVGVPSASANSKHGAPAEWNLYSIARDGGRWRTDVTIRQWQAATNAFTPAAHFTLGAA